MELQKIRERVNFYIESDTDELNEIRGKQKDYGYTYRFFSQNLERVTILETKLDFHTGMLIALSFNDSDENILNNLRAKFDNRITQELLYCPWKNNSSDPVDNLVSNFKAQALMEIFRVWRNTLT